MEILSLLKIKEIINQNPTQKTLILLGQIDGKQGQAIVIISPKLVTLEKIIFKNIKQMFQNNIYGAWQAQLSTNYDVQTIFPITEKHKKKYLKKTKKIVKQTQQMYEDGKKDLLERQLKHTQWIQNILSGKSQVQRVLLNDIEFMILMDLKYTDIAKVDNAHLNLIFKNPSLNSIRDLNESHIELLQKAEKSINQVLIKLKLQSQCRVYFHYPPTFYRLHIHIMNTMLSSGSSCVERSHELSTVIDNIKMKGNYYKQARLNKFIETNIV